ncbi:MAG: hypothetical protein ACLTZY_02565 [Alistipes indistinctus]
MKNGSVVECTGNDRLKMPQKNGKLKVFRDAFRKTKAKEILSPGDIDSVICWHAKSPEHTRKFLFAEKPGWMWVYVETPYIKACIYSKKGTASTPTAVYRSGNDADGSAVRGPTYFLQKQGDRGFRNVGSAYRRSKDTFRKRIACYIDDDPTLAERIRQSNAYRDKTILMLHDYDPTRH